LITGSFWRRKTAMAISWRLGNLIAKLLSDQFTYPTI
jgi:hypothetical protein